MLVRFAQISSLVWIASLPGCASDPHPARATGGTATPAPEAPWRPGETASKNQAETSSTTKDGGAQRPANAMPAPKPRACATLSDCVAACASADSQCSSQDRRVATTVKDICVDKCRNILKGSPKGLNRIPAKLFGFELERPFSDAEARCSELGGRWSSTGSSAAGSYFTCADMLGPWRIPFAVEVWGQGDVRRIELVYVLDSGETLSDVSLRFAHLFSMRYYGSPTEIQDQKTDEVLYHWWSERLGSVYHFRLLARERDDRTGQRAVRLWVQQEK